MEQIGKKTIEYGAAKRFLLRARSLVSRTGVMVFMLSAASAAGYLFRAWGLPSSDTVIAYLLAVLLTARFTRGYVFGLLSSVFATFAFNFLFTEPYFSLHVYTPSYFITFIIMTVTAIITSALTTRAKQNELDAREKEAEAKALYTLTNRLTDAADIHDIAAIATRAISQTLGVNAACLCFDENGKPEQSCIRQISPQEQVRSELPDAEELARRMCELKNDYAAGDEFYDWPIRGREATLGIVRIPKESAQVMSTSQNRMLHAMIESAALAMDRFRATQQRQKANEATVQERYRGNLIRAISHDLRTPLAGIMGTAEMVMGMMEENDDRYPLMAEIHKDANWLHSLVENTLSLTRLQDGKLVLHKQPEAVEEVVGAALRQIARHYPERDIEVHVPDELLVAPMDAQLIGQVLINLVENAIKHTDTGEEISIAVEKDAQRNCAVFSVRDRGEGLTEGDLPNLFQMFYTSRHRGADAQPGVGLGLAICEAAVKAHGGDIAARNRADRPGAEFIFTLPLEAQGHESE